MCIWPPPYWYWKCQYKHPRESAAATDDLAQQRLGVEIVADSGEGHQTPPERLNKGPTVIPIKSPSNLQREEIELSVQQLVLCSLLDFI